MTVAFGQNGLISVDFRTNPQCENDCWKVRVRLYPNRRNTRYDTLSVNVEIGGQNWPNIKCALKRFSGLFYVFYGIFIA